MTGLRRFLRDWCFGFVVLNVIFGIMEFCFTAGDLWGLASSVGLLMVVVTEILFFWVAGVLALVNRYFAHNRRRP